MKHIVKFIIPGQPIPKQRARRGPSGSWYNPQMAIMQDVSKKIKTELLPSGYSPIPFGTPVTLDLYFFFEPTKTELKQKNFLDLIKNDDYPYIRHKGDVDNIFKFYSDSMNRIVFDDDTQIYSSNIRKYYSLKPRTEVQVIYEI